MHLGSQIPGPLRAMPLRSLLRPWADQLQRPDSLGQALLDFSHRTGASRCEVLLSQIPVAIAG